MLKCTRITSGGSGGGDIIHPCLHEDRETSRERANPSGAAKKQDWFLAEARETLRTRDLRKPLLLGAGPALPGA